MMIIHIIREKRKRTTPLNQTQTQFYSQKQAQGT